MASSRNTQRGLSRRDDFIAQRVHEARQSVNDPAAAARAVSGHAETEGNPATKGSVVQDRDAIWQSIGDELRNREGTL